MIFQRLNVLFMFLLIEIAISIIQFLYLIPMVKNVFPIDVTKVTDADDRPYWPTSTNAMLLNAFVTTYLPIMQNIKFETE